GVDGICDGERVLAEQLIRLPEQRIDRASLIELGGVLGAGVRTGAAFDRFPPFSRVPPAIRSQPENFFTLNRLLSSKIRLCASSFGSLPIACSFGRTMSWATGSIVCVPQDCTLMNG